MLNELRHVAVGHETFGMFFHRTSQILICGIVAGTCGCGQNLANDSNAERSSAPAVAPTIHSPPWFDDATQQSGVTFHQTAHRPSPFFMPALTGGGIAVGDFDNDARLDIYLLNSASPQGEETNRFFRQTEDGRFEDATAGSGLDLHGYCQGVAAGDVNNDGALDVVVTEYGAARLLLGDGAGHFRDVSEEAGIDNASWGTSTAFLDFDRDGWLDLVIANYLEYDPDKPCKSTAGQDDFCGPASFPGTPPRLFRNLTGAGPSMGDVRFEDVTGASGLGSHASAGLGLWCADFDGDRWPDIFVANDGVPNSLFINRRDGTFHEEATLRGIALNRMGLAEANMGVAVGDADGDGLFDVFVTHLADESHRLWKQSPQGLFTDATTEARLSSVRGTGFGTMFADFDHDGDVDLAIANGRVMREAGTPPAATPEHFWTPYHELNAALENLGEGRFRDASHANPALCGTHGVYRGMACGDWDNDGDLDLVVSQLDGPPLLLRNVAAKSGHWLTVRTLDPSLRRDAYGAVVTVEAGGRRWVRWVNPSGSYACSNDPRAHFGLGETSEASSIRVIWPDGIAEMFPAASVDQHLVLRRGEGIAEMP